MNNIPKVLISVYLSVSFFVLISSFLFREYFFLHIILGILNFPLSSIIFFFGIGSLYYGIYFVLIIINGTVLYIVSQSFINYFLIKDTSSDNFQSIPKTNPLKSRLGAWFVGIHLIIATIIGIYGFNCKDMFCSMILLIPTLGVTYGGFNRPNMVVVYVTNVLIASFFVYVSGMIIQMVISKIKSRI